MGITIDSDLSEEIAFALNLADEHKCYMFKQLVSNRVLEFALKKGISNSMTTPTTTNNSWVIPPNNQVGLVTGRIRENAIATRQLHFLSNEISLYTDELTLLTLPNFSLGDWLHQNAGRYLMVDKNEALALFGDSKEAHELVYLYVNLSRSTIGFEVNGTFEKVVEFREWLKTQPFAKKEVMIEWTFGENYRSMESYYLPLDIREDIPGAYPWMKESIREYSQRFLASRESVLVLKGPPGTGKTSFLKKVIEHSGGSAMVTYDQNLLFSDGFFASFMVKENTDILVIEDADAMLGHREDGNVMMDRLLNTSDGLVSMRRKKIIFTTNLSNINSIDGALLRKGRCFDVMEFRRYTDEEALAVGKAYHGEDFNLVPSPSGHSLADITNIDRETRVATPTVKFGFSVS